MTTLTLQQLADFRIDLALGDTVFNDAELQRFYERADSDFDRAKVYALRALLANATKLHDYTAGAVDEKLSQIFSNLKYQLRELEAAAGMGGAVVSVGLVNLNIDATDANEDEWSA